MTGTLVLTDGPAYAPVTVALMLIVEACNCALGVGASPGIPILATLPLPEWAMADLAPIGLAVGTVKSCCETPCIFIFF